MGATYPSEPLVTDSNPFALVHVPRKCKVLKRNGERCKKNAMFGQEVCDTHGGRAPQNKAAAERRLRALYAEQRGLAIDVIKFSLMSNNEAIRLRAAQIVLDGHGFNDPDLAMEAAQERNASKWMREWATDDELEELLAAHQALLALRTRIKDAATVRGLEQQAAAAAAPPAQPEPVPVLDGYLLPEGDDLDWQGPTPQGN